MPAAIKTKGLTKKFGDFTAVDSLDLEVKKGEIFAFLGPNGAGKSTTIRMLTTLLPPTKGDASVSGYDIVDQANKVRKITGVVPQQVSLYMDLTARENLKLIGDLYEMDKKNIQERTKKLLKLVELWERRDSLVEDFSGGMKQRLSLAASLLHEPKIVFMDEPTAGLDPQTRISLRNLTKKLNKDGITIIYCTHDMEEAEKISDRVGIINKGVIEAIGSPDELKNKLDKKERVEIETEKSIKKIPKKIKKLKYVKKVSREGKILKIELKGKNHLSDLIKQVSSFTEIKKLRKVKPSLEDVFVKLTGGTEDE